MLELRNVSKHFSGISAVDGVSFCARPREVIGYLGRNGSGKTTTIENDHWPHSLSNRWIHGLHRRGLVARDGKATVGFTASAVQEAVQLDPPLQSTAESAASSLHWPPARTRTHSPAIALHSTRAP